MGSQWIPKLLSQLRDVLIISPANDEVLTYETASGKWKNKAASGGGSLLLSEQTLTQAATSVTLSGLDGNAHGGYNLLVSVPSSSPGSIYLFFNGDTSQGSYRYSLYGQETAGGWTSQGNDATIFATTHAANNIGTFGSIAINISSEGRILSHNRYTRMWNSGGSIETVVLAHAKIATVANLTSLTIQSSVANGLPIGTKLMLLRRK